MQREPAVRPVGGLRRLGPWRRPDLTLCRDPRDRHGRGVPRARRRASSASAAAAPSETAAAGHRARAVRIGRPRLHPPDPRRPVAALDVLRRRRQRAGLRGPLRPAWRAQADRPLDFQHRRLGHGPVAGAEAAVSPAGTGGPPRGSGSGGRGRESRRRGGGTDRQSVRLDDLARWSAGPRPCKLADPTGPENPALARRGSGRHRRHAAPGGDPSAAGGRGQDHRPQRSARGLGLRRLWLDPVGRRPGLDCATRCALEAASTRACSEARADRAHAGRAGSRSAGRIDP